MSWLDNEDLNGDCYVSGELGETEELRTDRTVIFPFGKNGASVPFEEVHFTADEATIFLNLNFYYLMHHFAKGTEEQNARASYLRFLAARQGIVSNRFDTKVFNVRYNEAVIEASNTEKYDWFDANPNAAGGAHPKLRAGLTAEIRKKFRSNFTNIVCCIAYMFRVRGHHFVGDMEDKYKDLWRKCLREEDDPGLKWEYIAHNALHAIMPLVLDGFWLNAVNNSNVAGALMKRYDSAPAGVAGVRALQAGMQDIATVVPGYKALNKGLYDDIDRLVTYLKNNRWAGSINRRFYGAGDLAFDEQKYSAVAATLLAALNQFAPTSPLKNSAALKRMSTGAPISGAFTARLITAAANSDDNSKALTSGVGTSTATV